ncbi:MAG: hypothetical protein Fur0032_15520 [Terrimicrobiaceae bacterium]
MPLRNNRPGQLGLTFVEVLVAGVIAAFTLTVGVMAFASILNNPARTTASLVLENLPSGLMADFYSSSSTTLSVPQAPNYGMAAAAANLRERLEADLAGATAAYCLVRNQRSTIRPAKILGLTDDVARSLTGPNEFLSHLTNSAASGVSGAAGIFQTFTGAALAATNSSLFILGPSQDDETAEVLAVYEVDFVPFTDPPGTYVSVRRYPGGGGDFDYYHVFYADDSGRFGVGDTNNFQPLTVHFPRSLATNGNAAHDLYCRAERKPFAFVWWPDPAMPRLFSTNTYLGNNLSPRSAYHGMADRTSLFFVVPTFPAL